MQQRLIVDPLLLQLPTAPVVAIPKLLTGWPYTGYGIGNLLNLAIVAQVSLQNWDLRQRFIAEVNFQGQILQGTDFRQATFDRCIFSQSMGSILCMIISPDGKYLAASDSSYQIKLWEIATHQEHAMLLGHEGWIWHITFSSNSKYLLSGCNDRTMRVWDVATGQCLKVIKGYEDWVWRVSFGVNNNLAISISADRSLQVWWWRSGRNLLSFKIPDLNLRDGAFHAKRGLVAVCGATSLKIWHIWTGRCIQEIVITTAGNLRSVIFSPDGRSLIGTTFDCELLYWNVDSGTSRHVFRGHPTQIFHANFIEGDRLISSCLEQVRVWDLNTGYCLQTISVASDSGKGILYRPPLLITGSDNGVVKSWNLESGKCLRSSTGNSPRVNELATNLQNLWVATTKDDGTLHLWDFSQPLATGIMPPSVELLGHRGLATNLAFSPNGRLLASTGSDRLIHIWDVDTRMIIQSLQGHTDTVDKLCFLDAHTLLSHGNDATSRQWDVLSGESEILADPRDHWCLTITCSADGRFLAWGTVSAQVVLLDRSTNERRELSAVGNRLRKLIYTHDGQHLIGVTDNGYLNCWEVMNNYHHTHWAVDPLQTTVILAHPHNPSQVFLALEDGSIALWDIPQQSCLQRVNTLPAGQRRQHHQAISSVCILPHPDRLMVCNVAGTIDIWGFTSQGLEHAYALTLLPLPYQGMKIANVKGLNQAQRLTLQLLGAEG